MIRSGSLMTTIRDMLALPVPETLSNTTATAVYIYIYAQTHIHTLYTYMGIKYIYIYNIFYKNRLLSLFVVYYTLYYIETAEAAAAASVRPVLMTGNGQSQITVPTYILYVYIPYLYADNE